jgi:hypothetical protein
MSAIFFCCRAYTRVQSDGGTTTVYHSRRPSGEVIFQQSKKPSRNAITASQDLFPPEATVLNMITRPAVKINESILFTHQQMHYLLNLERFEFTLEFTQISLLHVRSSTIIRDLVLSLAKVMLEHSVKSCPYRLCGGVAACLK